jgi:hypothetical protein
VNKISMSKPIRRLISGILLILTIALGSGCSESTRQDATGKGEIRGINSIVDAPELFFLIEERTIGAVAFKESTSLNEWDNLSYNFNFDLIRPGVIQPDRVATEFIDVITDTEYTVILTGTLDNPSIIRWEDPKREWTGTETVLEAIFTHLSPALGEVDVYFAPLGTTPILGGAIGSLVNGERLPITEYEQGDYELILTPPGDPSTILYISSTITVVAQNRPIFAIFDPDPSHLGPIAVNLIGSNGASINIADPNYASQLRLMHAAFGVENVDGYFDMDFNNLIFPDVGFQQLSFNEDIAIGLTNLNLTAVGNPGAEILSNDIITVPGTKRTVILSGSPGNVFLNSLAEDGRPVSTFPIIRVANFAVNYLAVDVYLEDPGTDINEALPRFIGLSTQLDTGFVPAIDGMRELTLTGFFGKDPIAVPIMLDLSAGSVVHIGIFDTVDPLVLEVVVYDVQ